MAWQMKKGGDFAGFTEGDIQKIFDECHSLTWWTESGEFEKYAELLGSRQLSDTETLFPLRIDAWGIIPSTEHAVAVCADKKISLKTASEGEEEEGPEYEAELEDYTSVIIPEDICHPDSYIGSIHTHPNYPCTPSPADIDYSIHEKHKVSCIATKDRFMCIFKEPNAYYPARKSDWHEFKAVESKEIVEEMLDEYLDGLEVERKSICLPGIVRIKSDYFPVDEDLEICPIDYQRGHEAQYIQQIREEMRENKGILGVCYYDKKSGKTLNCYGPDRTVEYEV